jgi:hypothetical protein
MEIKLLIPWLHAYIYQKSAKLHMNFSVNYYH